MPKILRNNEKILTMFVAMLSHDMKRMIEEISSNNVDVFLGLSSYHQTFENLQKILMFKISDFHRLFFLGLSLGHKTFANLEEIVGYQGDFGLYSFLDLPDFARTMSSLRFYYNVQQEIFAKHQLESSLAFERSNIHCKELEIMQKNRFSNKISLLKKDERDVHTYINLFEEYGKVVRLIQSNVFFIAATKVAQEAVLNSVIKNEISSSNSSVLYKFTPLISKTFIYVLPQSLVVSSSLHLLHFGMPRNFMEVINFIAKPLMAMTSLDLCDFFNVNPFIFLGLSYGYALFEDPNRVAPPLNDYWSFDDSEVSNLTIDYHGTVRSSEKIVSDLIDANVDPLALASLGFELSFACTSYMGFSFFASGAMALAGSISVDYLVTAYAKQHLAVLPSFVDMLYEEFWLRNSTQEIDEMRFLEVSY